MSREVSKQSRNIFVTVVRQADGSTKPVISSKALSEKSLRVNRTWEGVIWAGNEVEKDCPGKYRTKYISAKCTNSGVLFLLMLLQSRGCIYQKDGLPFLNSDIWLTVASLIFGVSSYTHLNLIDRYAIATTPHSLTHHQQLGIFSHAKVDPEIVVDAAMRGQEEIVLNMLRTDPHYLLKRATVENVVGIKSIRTPLQAAIMGTDIQLVERMKTHFERLPNGLAIMYKQILDIYKESLWRYCQKQQALVNQLIPLQIEGVATIAELDALKTAESRVISYLPALHNNGNNHDDPNYLTVIVEAHDQAQKDNAFDFKPYIDAVCNLDKHNRSEFIEAMPSFFNKEKRDGMEKEGVSPIEIGFIKDGEAYTRDEVQALPFSQLTLLQKMNRFREKLVEHRRKEIISNPYHIIKSAMLHMNAWFKLEYADLSDIKRSIIFSQIYGFAQVTAEEAVRQDLRQGVLDLLRKNKRPRQRPSDLNYMCYRGRDTSAVDRLSHRGWGYEFGCTVSKGEGGVIFRGIGTFSTRNCANAFLELNKEKKTSFEDLLRNLCENMSASQKRARSEESVTDLGVNIIS